MESGAPKMVRARLHALFPDAEPHCRALTDPVPSSLSGRKEDLSAEATSAQPPVQSPW